MTKGRQTFGPLDTGSFADHLNVDDQTVID